MREMLNLTLVKCELIDTEANEIFRYVLFRRILCNSKYCYKEG